jgi:single-strand DNA-binding protein
VVDMSECCKSCGSVDLKVTIMNHGPHYSRIDCNDCGKFVKWGKKPEKQDTQKNINYTGGQGMNNVSLVGRLTKDVEVKYTSSKNTAVAGFNLAVNRSFKQEGQPEADFITIVAWEKTAEFCNKYFKKGQQIWVNGRLQTRNWEDSEGKKHYVTEVVAEKVGFADSKKDGNGESSGQQNTPQQQPSNPPSQMGQQQPSAGKMPWEQ